MSAAAADPFEFPGEEERMDVGEGKGAWRAGKENRENEAPVADGGERRALGQKTQGGWACKRADKEAAGRKATSTSTPMGSPGIVLRRVLSVGQDQLQRDRAAITIAKVVQDKNILRHVLRHLPKPTLAACSLVNRRWAEASRHPSLWTRVNLTNRKIALVHLHAVMDRQPHVMRLHRADIELEGPSASASSSSVAHAAPATAALSPKKDQDEEEEEDDLTKGEEEEDCQELDSFGEPVVVVSMNGEESPSPPTNVEGRLGQLGEEDEMGDDASLLSQKSLVGWEPPEGAPLKVDRLAYLDLSMAIYDGAPVLLSILRRCRGLVCLSLELGSLSDDVCAEIAQNGKMEQVNLTMASGLTAAGLRAIVGGCRRLEQLNLAWTELSGSAVAELCRSAPESLASLSLAGAKGAALETEHARALARAAPRLRELDLSDLSKLSTDALEALLKSRRLDTLHVSRCYLPDPQTLAVVCQGLKELNAFGVFSADHLQLLRSSLPRARVNHDQGLFSAIARPTVGIRRSSIWLQSVRDE